MKSSVQLGYLQMWLYPEFVGFHSDLAKRWLVGWKWGRGPVVVWKRARGPARSHVHAEWTVDLHANHVADVYCCCFGHVTANCHLLTMASWEVKLLTAWARHGFAFVAR